MHTEIAPIISAIGQEVEAKEGMAKVLLVDFWRATKWGIAAAIMFVIFGPLWGAHIGWQEVTLVFLAVTFLLIAAVIYMVPWSVARRRGHRNATAIGLFNLFFGWTVAGWAIALVWANWVDKT